MVRKEGCLSLPEVNLKLIKDKNALSERQKRNGGPFRKREEGRNYIRDVAQKGKMSRVGGKRTTMKISEGET